MVSRALVVVVDDDLSVRESLPELLRQCGFATAAFASADDFLGSNVLDLTSCLVLDVVMPGLSGIELARELARQGRAMPIVFISGDGDESDRARMLREGAVEFLFKPFSEAELLAAVMAALGEPATRVP
jgi:FixJ family two-component response regulator